MTTTAKTDPPARRDAHGPMPRWVKLFSAALVVGGLVLAARNNYLLFHSVGELFSIAVGIAIFMMAWNARGILDSDYLLFIGIAYLFISGIDLLHTLAYQGMGVFPGEDADAATQLWVGARYLESVTLLVAPVFLHRRLRPSLGLAVYSAAAALLVISVFGWRIFPPSFIEGSGLTPFKIYSEYAICFLLAAALFVLYRRRNMLNRRMFRLLFSSILATMASELFFTEYASVYGTLNLLGHVFKIVSFYLVYKALIEEGLSRPYEVLFRDLKRSEEALRRSEKKFRALTEHSPVGVYLTDEEGRCRLVNDRWCAMTGRSTEEASGRDWFSFVHPEDVARVKKSWHDMVNKGYEFTLEYRCITWRGPVIWVAGHAVALQGGSGGVTEYLGTATDITERKMMEKRLQEMNATLEQQVRERTAVAERRASQLRAMAMELAQTEQRERRRLAEILHDQLQQLLVGVKIQLAFLGNQVRGDEGDEIVRRAADLLDQSIDMSRSLTVELSPPVLHAGGLIPALHWLADWMEEKHGVRVEIRADERAEPEVEDIRVCLFQAVRELLFNAVKHAQAHRTLISAGPHGEGGIMIVVEDDGIGFEAGSLGPAVSPKGFGLFSIRERLGLLGGDLSVSSSPGKGSRITLRAPSGAPPPGNSS